MAQVRVFGYGGIVQIEQRMLKFHNSDSVFMRQEPYQWSAVLTLTGSTPVALPVQTNDDNTTMVVVEVDDLVTVRYEVNPTGPLAVGARVASTASPKLRGENVFQWFKGASMSFIDVT